MNNYCIINNQNTYKKIQFLINKRSNWVSLSESGDGKRFCHHQERVLHQEQVAEGKTASSLILRAQISSTAKHLKSIPQQTSQVSTAVCENVLGAGFATNKVYVSSNLRKTCLDNENLGNKDYEAKQVALDSLAPSFCPAPALETDFAKIVALAKRGAIRVLIVDYQDYASTPEAFQIFRKNSAFEIPFVIITGDNPGDYYFPYPNFYHFEYNAILDILRAIYNDNLVRNVKLNDIGKLNRLALFVQKSLVQLGLSSGTLGTILIRDCIVKVLSLDCKPCSLSKEIYPIVSKENHTSIDNLIRCARVSLETAWKRRKKNAPRLEYDISFDDFLLCPSIKEFIYYLAFKLKLFNLNHEDD